MNHMIIDPIDISELSYKQNQLQGIYKNNLYTQEEKYDIYMSGNKSDLRKELIKSNEVDYLVKLHSSKLTRDKKNTYNNKMKTMENTNSMITNSSFLNILKNDFIEQNETILYKGLEDISDRREIVNKISQYKQKMKELVLNSEELGGFRNIFEVDFYNEDKRVFQLTDKINSFRKFNKNGERDRERENRLKKDFTKMVSKTEPISRNIKNLMAETSKLQKEIFELKEEKRLQKRPSNKEILQDKIKQSQLNQNQSNDYDYNSPSIR